MPAEVLRQQLAESASQDECIELLRRVHPEKCAEVGEPALRGLWRDHQAESEALTLTSRESQVWLGLQLSSAAWSDGLAST